MIAESCLYDVYFKEYSFLKFQSISFTSKFLPFLPHFILKLSGHVACHYVPIRQLGRFRWIICPSYSWDPWQHLGLHGHWNSSKIQWVFTKS